MPDGTYGTRAEAIAAWTAYYGGYVITPGAGEIGGCADPNAGAGMVGAAGNAGACKNMAEGDPLDDSTWEKAGKCADPTLKCQKFVNGK